MNLERELLAISKQAGNRRVRLLARVTPDNAGLKLMDEQHCGLSVEIGDGTWFNSSATTVSEVIRNTKEALKHLGKPRTGN